jgi:hypothetical protein
MAYTSVLKMEAVLSLGNVDKIVPDYTRSTPQKFDTSHVIKTVVYYM